MNKTFKTTLALMAGAIAFTACSNDEEFENINEPVVESQLHKMTFFASQEGQEGATRAEIDGLDIKWSAGDKISIFDGVHGSDGSYAREFTIDEGEEGNTTASFSGEAAESETYYAIYPYVVSKILERKCVNDAEVAAVMNNQWLDEEEIEYMRGYLDVITQNKYFAALSADVQLKVLIYLYNGVYDINGSNATSDKEVYTDAGISAATFRGLKNNMNYLKSDLFSLCELSQEEADKLFYYLIEEGDIMMIEKTGVERNSSNQFEKLVIPSEQTVAAGEYVDQTAMLMIGMSDDKNSIQFKNVCAYVKVTPEFDCSIIALTSNGAENLAGTVTVDYNGGAPTTTVTANGTNAIYLTGSITAGNTYYIAVRPEALESGFKIEFITADGSHFYQRSSAKVLSLARNKVINLGSFSTSGTWTIESATSGTADGHEWALVSPTLKLATTIPEGTESGVLRSEAEGLWGANWVLPSVEDLRTMSMGLPWDYENHHAYLKGAGILRNIRYDLPAVGDNYWTSSYKDDNEMYPYIYTLSGMSYPYGEDPMLDSRFYAVLYKYIGE